MAKVNSRDQSKRRPKELKPFYEKPADVTTSSDIIQQARSSLRTVRTNRPFTPLDDKRTLFSGTAARSPSDRPPSAFSLGARHFDGSDSSRPVSAARLSPLDHIPSQPVSPSSPSSSGEYLPHLAKPPKPPPGDPSRPSSSKRRTLAKLKNALSQDGLSVLPQPMERRMSNPLPPSPPNPSDVLQRRVHSGPPKERNKPQLDGSIPRIKSADNLPVHRAEVLSKVSAVTAESGYSSDRPSSGGHSVNVSQDEDLSAEDLYWRDKVTPVLGRLVPEHAGKVQVVEEERLCKVCNALYQILSDGSFISRTSKQRRAVLKVVFKLTDVSNPRVQLHAARLMMALGVNGNNLNTLSKLLLKVSKDNTNDVLFMENNLIELIIAQLGELDYATHSNELLVYLVGSIRFLTQNCGEILDRVVQLGSVAHLARIMTSVNRANQETGKPARGSLGIIFQLMATLANVVNHKGHSAIFVSHGIIPGICRCMELYSSDSEIMMHVARILSKLTMSAECCTVLGEYPTSFSSMLGLVSRYQDVSSLVVRVGFALGNLTAKNDNFRSCLFSAENAMEMLQNALRHHFVRSLQNSKSTKELTTKPKMDKDEDGEGSNISPDPTEDVLIKIIRVIANLSVNQDIGPLVTSNENCVDQLMQILEYKDAGTSEELVLNTLITVNNLSFYDTVGSVIVERQEEISRLLLKCLMRNNMEIMTEASRVFGNLSRGVEVRNFLTSKKVDLMMITLLDAGNREIVYTACGILINMMADEHRRPVLKSEGGIKKLIDVLVYFGRSDWQLAGMVCMVLWNYSEGITNSVDCFGDQEAGSLIDKLVDFLDEDTALDTPESAAWDPDTCDYMKSCWHTLFCPVASQLLSRAERHQSDLVPIGDTPSLTSSKAIGQDSIE